MTKLFCLTCKKETEMNPAGTAPSGIREDLIYPVIECEECHHSEMIIDSEVDSIGNVLCYSVVNVERTKKFLTISKNEGFEIPMDDSISKNQRTSLMPTRMTIGKKKARISNRKGLSQDEVIRFLLESGVIPPKDKTDKQEES